MHRDELINFMLATGEYGNRVSAGNAIDRKIEECREQGMTDEQAWNSTVEFMELTLGEGL